MCSQRHFIFCNMCFSFFSMCSLCHVQHIGNTEFFPLHLLQCHLPMALCQLFGFSAQTWHICGATANPLEDLHDVTLRDVLSSSPLSGMDHFPYRNRRFMFLGHPTQPVLAFPLTTCSLGWGHSIHEELAVSDEMSLVTKLIRAGTLERLFYLIPLQKCQMQFTLAPSMIN